MADPLSIAASIAGLVALTDTLFRTVIKFNREVRGAKQEITKLATEIRDLSGILHNLSLLASSLESGTEETVFRLHHVNSCRKSVLDMQSKLSKEIEALEVPKTARSISRKLLWPYTSNEMRSLLGDVSRHKDTMKLALAADSMKAIMQSLSNQSELDQKLSKIGASVKEVKEISTRITMDRHRREILDFFLVVNPQRNLDTSLRLRHPLTGLWLTDSDPFRQWLEVSNAKLWLSGIPGAGKTVLAGLITQDVLQLAAAQESCGACFFFCDYKDPTSHSLSNILSSLASQLARQNDQAFEILQSYYEYLHPNRGLSRSPDEGRMKEIFLEMVDTFDRVYVIIDGLDECGTDPSVVIGVSSIASSSALVSIAILSRNEFHIRERLEDIFEHVEIAAQIGDIQLYVASELDIRIKDKRLRIRNLDLKDEVIDRLIKGAKGMFRWVSCQLDYLCELPTDYEIRDALGKLPPTLTATYERILSRKKHPRAVQIIRTVLRLIALVKPPLTIEELCDAASLRDNASSIEPDDIVQEDDIARLCGSLIRKWYGPHLLQGPEPPKVGFELAHFTVKEFLQSQVLQGTDLEVYFMEPSEGNEYLITTSLRFLTLDNFNIMVCTPKEAFDATNKTAKLHPFYTYASVYWLHCNRSMQGFPILNGRPVHISMPQKSMMKAGPPQSWLAPQRASTSESDTDTPDDGQKHRLRSVRLPQGTKSCSVPQGCFDLARRFFGAEKSPAFVIWCVQLVRIYRSRYTGSSSIYEQQFEDLYEIISVLISADFTTLHMASALHLPTICEALLQEGADPNLECGVGSVFQCTILGPLFLVRYKIDYDPPKPRTMPTGPADYGDYGDCLETLMVLKKYEATWTSFVTYGKDTLSPLEIPFIRFGKRAFGTLELFSYLMQSHPIPLTVGVLERFKEYSGRMGYDHGAPKYLRAAREVVEERSGDPGLIIKLKEELTVWLEKHPSYVGQPTLCRNLSANDFEYYQSVCTALEYDNVGSLEGFALDSRIWDFHKWHTFNASALHVAAHHGSARAVKHLVGFGIDASCRDKNGRTPLHYCCRPFRAQNMSFDPRLSTKAAVALLDCGASETAIDESGNTIWHLAACVGWDSLIRQLLKRDGSIDTHSDIFALNAAGLSPLSLALSHKHISAAVLLLPRFRNCPNLVGNLIQPYRVAAERGSEALIQALMECGVPAIPHDRKPSDTGTPLHYISPNSSPRCAQLLKAHYPGACVVKFNGRTPLEALLYRSFHTPTTCVINKDLLMELVPENLSYDTPDGRLLWLSICERYIVRARGSDALLDSVGTILDAFLDLNFISFAERDETEVPLLALANALRNLLPEFSISSGAAGIYNFSPYSPGSVFRLQQTIIGHLRKETHGQGNKISDWVLILLEVSVRMDWSNLAIELLRRNVSVHDRPTTEKQRLSALEAACISSSRCSAGLLEHLLDHAQKDKLDELNPSLGAGLIHILGRGGLPSRAQRRAKLEEVLDRGANPNVLDATRSSPAVVYHLLGGEVETAQLLLDHGANHLVCNNQGVNAILGLVWNADVSRLKSLIGKSETIDWSKTCSLDDVVPRWAKMTGSCNALHLACLAGSLKCLKFLLDNTSLKDVDARADGGYTCSHFAASVEYGGGDLLEYLKSQGADLDAQSQSGESPLHTAVSFGRKHSVRALLRLGATPTADKKGRTLVAQAFVDRDPEMINIFSDHGTAFVSGHVGASRTQTDGSSLLPALRHAIRKGDLEACQQLRNLGCPLDKPIRSCNHCTPFLYALSQNDVPNEIVLWLVQNDGGVWTEICKDHNTSSSINGTIGPIQFIIEHDDNNDLLESFFNQYRKFWPEWLVGSDNPAGHLAIAGNNYDGLKILLDWVQDLQNQPTPSEYPRIPSLDNFLNFKYPVPPLCLAVDTADYELVELLIEYGANVNIQDGNGQTPLRIAVQSGSTTDAELLLKSGAKPNTRDGQFFTPLAIAVSDSDQEMIDLLLSYGADPFVRDPWGDSLLADCWTRHTFQHLLPLGLDPYLKNLRGVSMIHKALVNPNIGLFILQKSLIPAHDHTEPIPPSQLKEDIATIGPLLPKMVRILGKATVQSMVDTEPTSSTSPLCEAAIYGFAESIETLLDIGAELEFEGHQVGTALMTASAHGELEAVRILTRRGAEIHYVRQKSGSPKSAVAYAEPYPEIQRWFLVERYTEQAKIESGSVISTEDEGLRPWSGVRQVIFPLVGKRARKRSESSFAFLCRLRKLKLSLRNTVIYYNQLWE